jgi:C1A family cysteine protease
MAEQEVSLSEIRSAIDKEGAHWEAAETSVFLLPPDERRLRLGVPPPEGGYDEVMREARTSGAVAPAPGAPSTYDLRNVNGKNFITPIRDQLNCGSCVAFGTIATIEGLAQVQHNNPSLNIDLSEAHLFFCLGTATGASCAAGWMPDKAFNCASNTGICDEKCYPYDLGKTDCAKYLCSDWQKRVTKVVGARPVTASQIKTQLSTKGPVTACFVVYSDFFAYKSGIYRHVTGGQAGGHCVSIVGYDDTSKFWIAKNSWGKNWGEQGFFRIAYGECGIDTWMNYTADKTM